MGKLIGSKNSTSLMREIKPSTLTRLFGALPDAPLHDQAELHSLRQTCENVREEIIQFSGYKPRRKDHVSEEERRKYERVFSLIMRLNQVYEKLKDEEKSKKTQEEIFRSDYKQMMNELSDDPHEDDDEEEEEDEQDEGQDEDVQPPPLLRTLTTRTRTIRVPLQLVSSLAPPRLKEPTKSEEATLAMVEEHPPAAVAADGAGGAVGAGGGGEEEVGVVLKDRLEDLL